MTICPNSGKACECQPQEGVMCPHGPTPNDWQRLMTDDEKMQAIMPGSTTFKANLLCPRCGWHFKNGLTDPSGENKAPTEGMLLVCGQCLAILKSARERPAWCPIHQHHKWCDHNGGVMGPTGWEAGGGLVLVQMAKAEVLALAPDVLASLRDMWSMTALARALTGPDPENRGEKQ